ncbi:hypothetical protein HOC32_03725 [Candidatus Woesearchaeota archaeon]|jgi:hypothetical protein|nr:hypothetical protein [Candidatus Woesearchaeota archaeon]
MEEDKKEYQDHMKKHHDDTKHGNEHMGEHKTISFRKHKNEHKEKEIKIAKPIWALLLVVVVIIFFNQYQIGTVSGMVHSTVKSSTGSLSLLGGDLSAIDINELKSTGHTVAAVFPVESFQTAEDAMAAMFPTGTPDYGEQLGVSYDDPIGSLATLANMYRGLKVEVEQNNPEGWQRFMSLASKPVGISCEYCCGLKTIGIDKNGNSACGCQHNPALLSVALYLSAYTDYSDGEILQEVMKWKTLFFPKNMIELGASLAGGDTSSLKDLPGMVGGC